MADIKAILDMSRPIDNIIDDLKKKSVNVPKWDLLIKDYDPTLHAIVQDTTTRKDKIKSDGSVEKASRISIGMEKLLSRRMTEFMFAIPVRRTYHNSEDNDTRKQIAKAIESIYKYARVNSENIKRGNAYFASCEVFTIWYTVENPNTLYGFSCQYKLKCRSYSPMGGERLYPLIDETGDMLAMSFEYKKQVADEKITIFETYTANIHYQWQQQGTGWEQTKAEPISILKIPAVYISRPAPIWHGLSYLRNEIEYTLSRNSDVIAYNSAPILKVSGAIQGREDKGESRRVYRVESGGDVAYVSWSQAIEALKYHVSTLIGLFWSQSQMPDISFENMKSIGNIGFDARQTLLTDAHLKVGDESGAWIEFFERECSVIKAFLKKMNSSWASEVDNVEVEHTITPFIQLDEDATTDRLIKQNGGKAIKSQLQTIREAGANNPDEVLRQIREEEAEMAQNSIRDMFNEGAE